MIKQIIEKYQEWERDTDGRRIGQVVRNIPALEHDIEQEMEKLAVAFAEWIENDSSFYRQTKALKQDANQLYERFKFEQWAEREKYEKVMVGDKRGWMLNAPGAQQLFSDDNLYSQFKQAK